MAFGSLVLWCVWLIALGGFFGYGLRMRILTAGLALVLSAHLLSSRVPPMLPIGMWLLAAVAVLPDLLTALRPVGLTALSGATGLGLLGMQAARAFDVDPAATGALAASLVARLFGERGTGAATAAIAALLLSSPELLRRLGEPLLIPTPEVRYQCLAVAVGSGLLLDRLRRMPARRGRRLAGV